ncbi:MAG TPA: Fe-S cluster assembly protein SufD [Spirochaetia bacterium]|nr:Fe-S cluster assembly protein SufD [Spirochaetia bacterium]
MANPMTRTAKDTSLLAEGGFRRFIKGRSEPVWMTGLREWAWQRFTHMEWPTPQEEEWRRTDLSGIDFASYVNNGNGHTSIGDDETPIEEESMATGPYAGVIRFNGETCVQLSLSRKYRGVRLCTLDQCVAEEPGPLQQILMQGLNRIDNRLQAWHYSYLSHGAYLYVPRHLEIEEPFLLDFHGDGGTGLSVPEVIVRLDEGARASVIHRLQSRGSGQMLCNSGLHFQISDSAALSYYALQDLDESALCFSHGQASVARDARLNYFQAEMGAALIKNRFECILEGKGSEASLGGVYLARGRQHMDIRSVQRHHTPLATSRSFFKGAVRDSARTIYQGLIEVSPQAAKTDAYLTNRNLILNEGARADSIPSLQIDTNDVKCSHGSTTGKVDREQLFYLMSRGLARAEAERLLVLGYFEELLAGVPEILAEEVRALIQERI